MGRKVRVLFVTQSKLQHYRIPIFRIVNAAPDIELTLAHCGNSIVQNEISEILLQKKRIGSLHTINNFERICEDYDVILCMFYYDNLSFLKLINKHKRLNKKVILWSIGVPASYNRKYGDAGKLRYKILYSFQNKANAILFYSDAPLKILKEKGIDIDTNKVFIANNTVEVLKQYPESNLKKSFLFIGTLYLEKGLQILLDAYRAAYEENHDLFPLNIVGGGEQFEKVKEWVLINCLDKKIKLLGPIFDTDKKAEVFKESIACISPKQAGLSVLESMGYGVPFITSEDAITGGEAFNIIHEENGLRIKDLSQLKNILLDINNNPTKYFSMGIKAFEYYWENRTIEIMANGIISAINYAKNH